MTAILLLFIVALTPVQLAICANLIEKKNAKVPAKKIKQIKVKNSLAVKEKHRPDVYDDCVAALLSLGMKKREAKLKAEIMFRQSTYDKVENFLMDVYKNE